MITKKQKITQRISRFINSAKYTIFGPLFCPDNKDLESEKVDIATGGEDIGDLPLLKDEKPIIGQGLKIMTSKQMITRMPILLAQLKAGNTSKKI